MRKFENADKIGLRDKDTNEIIAIYPFKAEGSDAEIEKSIKDWFYKQSCSAENQLRNAYVDIIK